MKRILLIACVLFSMTMLVSAETKKVAILEVQDNENVLETGQKLMLQSSLSKAVAKTPGYEAFDRTSMEKLMEEQLFQRSGFADQTKICEMGKLAGASYIMISEAAKTADRMVVVAVKLLNVETAKIETSESIVLNGSSEEMQSKCDQLASSLLDRKKHLSKLLGDEPAGSKELLTRVGWSHYVYNGDKMNKKEYEQFLVRKCTPAYKQYHNGKIMMYSAYGTLCLGVLGIGIGAPCLALGKSTTTLTAGKAMIAIGAISLAGSATLFTFGILSKNKSVNTFNNQCLSKGYNLQFDIIAGSEGLGIAMKF